MAHSGQHDQEKSKDWCSKKEGSMTNNLEDELQRMVARMDEQHDNHESETNTPHEDIEDIYVLIVRESEEEDDHKQVVESTPLVPSQSVPVTTIQHNSFLSAYVFVCFSLLLILATLAFQSYCIINPPIANVPIIPKSQTVALSGTVQLGRVLPPLTISQSQTTPATGKGNQPAEQARGSITFYNGQFQTVTVAAGTIFTGADGIQIVTDQDADIPAGNPPNYGQVSVAAHAINAGMEGNISAYDINQVCCATSVLAKNINAFYGGQDERNFPTVLKADISSVAIPLITEVTRSMSGAVQGQLHPNEQLFILPCTPTVISDHPIGAEATQVKVTVSETCSAVAYNSQELGAIATSFLATQAFHKPGAGYSLFGTVHVSVKQASVNHTATHLVFLSFQAQGTWIYGLSHTAQESIKKLIAGKTTQEAVNLLASSKGIEQASIRFSGFGDTTRLPKSIENIHLTIIVV
jgi:VCBS repeat-containing protein